MPAAAAVREDCSLASSGARAIRAVVGPLRRRRWSMCVARAGWARTRRRPLSLRERSSRRVGGVPRVRLPRGQPPAARLRRRQASVPDRRGVPQLPRAARVFWPRGTRRPSPPAIPGRHDVTCPSVLRHGIGFFPGARAGARHARPTHCATDEPSDVQTFRLHARESDVDGDVRTRPHVSRRPSRLAPAPGDETGFGDGRRDGRRSAGHRCPTGLPGTAQAGSAGWPGLWRTCPTALPGRGARSALDTGEMPVCAAQSESMASRAPEHHHASLRGWLVVVVDFLAATLFAVILIAGLMLTADRMGAASGRRASRPDSPGRSP